MNHSSCPSPHREACRWAAWGLACALGSGSAGAAAPAAGAIDVQHVAVDLQLDWPARQARGLARLTLATRSSTDVVALDAAHLAIEQVSLGDGRALGFTHVGGNPDAGLNVQLDRTYAAGEALTVRVRYHTRWVNHSDPEAIWGSDGSGIRFFEPTATDARKRRQAWTSGLPQASRYWFPSPSDASDRHTSELRATVPAPLSVIASGRLLAVEPQPGGARRFHWRMDHAHTSQRSLWVVGEYEDQPQTAAGVALHNFGYPDEAQAVRDSVAQLPATLRFLNDLTGVRYPFDSYTQVFVQDLPWGHAGAGLAMQTENMIDDHGTHEDFQYLWDGLQTESLAQQWFGVHMNACSPHHLWLERGLAHHLAALFTEHRHGREEMLLWYVAANQATVLADWAGGQRQALVPQQLDDVAGFATGNTPSVRGAAVLNLLRQTVGDSAWRRVLRHFAQAHAGQAVCSADLQRAVQAVTGDAMDWFFEQWLRRADHPVFEVAWRHDEPAGRLTMTVRQLQDAAFQGPVDIDIDGQVRRVWLQPQSENVFHFEAAVAPRLVHFDHESAWIKELRFAKPAAELLHQMLHSRDAMGRQWAMGELARLAKAAPESDPLRRDFESALRQLATSPHYWRVRFNALGQWRNLLTPARAGQAAALSEVSRDALLSLIDREGSWLRAAALGVLGQSRDPAHASVYLQHLRDRSDRVINAAAIALGRSGSPLAYEALLQLPRHPSWKNQSLISALAGLKELGDPRAADLAWQALGDVHSPRWTLATPIWDYRIAAAQLLASLGQGGRGLELVQRHLDQALAAGEINDIFSNLLLLATLADDKALAIFAALKPRWAGAAAGDAAAARALQQYETQLREALKAP